MPGPNQQVFEPDLPTPSQRRQALLSRSSLQRAPRAPTRRFRGIGAHRLSTPARRRRRGVQSRPGYEPHTRALTRFQGLVSAEGRHQHPARGVSIAVQVPESRPTAATVHTQRHRSRMQHIARDPRRNLPSGTCPVSLLPECDAGNISCLSVSWVPPSRCRIGGAMRRLVKRRGEASRRWAPSIGRYHRKPSGEPTRRERRSYRHAETAFRSSPPSLRPER